MARPPHTVLEAFDTSGEPVALAGGEGVAFRVGDSVLKRVLDVGEAEWTQATLAEIDEDGFRVPTPRRTAAGGWVHDGWVASMFVPDLRPAAPRWADIAECGLRFADAAERVRPRRADVLDARTHRWAVADRLAWEDADVKLAPAASEVCEKIAEFLGPHPSSERHFVHGDLSGNVCLDGDDELVVLDVSPYLRHRRWAAAIVVADAVLWHGADIALAEEFADDPLDRDLFGRALMFRLIAEELAPDSGDCSFLSAYERILARLV